MNRKGEGLNHEGARKPRKASLKVSGLNRLSVYNQREEIESGYTSSLSDNKARNYKHSIALKS